MLDFGGGESLTVWLGVFKVDGDELGVGAVIIVGGFDEDGVKVGKGHEKVFTGGLLTIDTLPAGLKDLNLHTVLSVCMEWLSVLVLKGDVVSSKNNISGLIGTSGSGELESVLENSSIGGNLVSEELFWQFPVQSLSAGLLETSELDGTSGDFGSSLWREWLTGVRCGQLQLVTIPTGIVDGDACSFVVRSRTLLSDT